MANSADDPKPPKKANVRGQKPSVARSKAKSAKKATPVKKDHKAPKPAKLAKSGLSTREGSKAAKVLGRTT